ncbi:hypothetical protein ABEU86_17805 [Pseudomonas paraversuta]
MESAANPEVYAKHEKALKTIEEIVFEEYLRLLETMLFFWATDAV